MKDAPATIESAVEISQSKYPFLLAVKLVRGAYMKTEARQVIHNTFEDTNRCFDTGVARLLDQENVRLMIASHNHASVTKALALSRKAKGKLSIAQLYGMSDDITYSLTGFDHLTIYKYVPYVKDNTDF